MFVDVYEATRKQPGAKDEKAWLERAYADLSKEPFDVAVDFPLGYLRAVLVPFLAFFAQEVLEGRLPEGFSHQVAGFQLV